MKRERRLFILWRYALLFLMICFVITASFLLFGKSMRFDEDEVRRSAILVLGNIVLLSLVCCGFEWLLHRFTVQKPVKLIRDAAHELACGNFSARIDTGKFNVMSRDFLDIARDINIMAEELSLTETLRTDFVSNVSHEMKTPLSVIRNYAALLKNETISDEERIACAEGAQRQVIKLTELITNILKLNRLEHQQIQLNPVSFDLSSQLEQCAIDFDDAMTAKNIFLDADIGEKVFITADPELLSIVWNNLLSNAIKFSNDGGQILLSLKTEGDEAVVLVRDFGIGMDEKTGRHIFDKFYQGDTSHATEGNGLGLALVKRVVDITGGYISVISELGKGSEFTVRLGRNINER